MAEHPRSSRAARPPERYEPQVLKEHGREYDPAIGAARTAGQLRAQAATFRCMGLNRHELSHEQVMSRRARERAMWPELCERARAEVAL
jgi:hypothetical protein